MTDVFAQMTADALAAVGVSAVYTPSGGSGLDVRVVVNENVEGVGEHGQVMHFGTVIDVSRADVDQPAYGDTIEVDGTTYTAREIIERDQYVSRVVVDG